MKAKPYATLLIVFVLACFQSYAQATGTLFLQRAVNANEQQILRIDPYSGQQDTVITMKGLMGKPPGLTLDKANNMAYFLGLDVNAQSHVYCVDLNTSSVVGNPLCSENYTLGNPRFNAYDGNLYLQREVSLQTEQIIRIHPQSGQFDTVITLTGFQGGTSALTIDAVNNRAYFIGWDSFSQNRVYGVDLQSGALISNALCGVQYRVGDPDFNPVDGRLYMMAAPGSKEIQILSIDPGSGATDTIISMSETMSSTSPLTLDYIGNKAYFVEWDEMDYKVVVCVDLVTGKLISNTTLVGQYNQGDPTFLWHNPTQEEEGIDPRGFDNTLFGNSFYLYPNPATEYIKLIQNNPLCVNKEYIFTLMDVAGNKISVTRFTKEMTLDLSARLKGVYLYHISDGGTLFINGRLVKE